MLLKWNTTFPFYHINSHFQKFGSYSMSLEKREKNWRNRRNFTPFPQKALRHVATYELLKHSLFKEPILDLTYHSCSPKTYERKITLERTGRATKSCVLVMCVLGDLVYIPGFAKTGSRNTENLNLKTPLLGFRYYLCLINTEAKFQIWLWFLSNFLFFRKKIK